MNMEISIIRCYISTIIRVHHELPTDTVKKILILKNMRGLNSQYFCKDICAHISYGY